MERPPLRHPLGGGWSGPHPQPLSPDGARGDGVDGPERNRTGGKSWRLWPSLGWRERELFEQWQVLVFDVDLERVEHSHYGVVERDHEQQVDGVLFAELCAHGVEGFL